MCSVLSADDSGELSAKMQNISNLQDRVNSFIYNFFHETTAEVHPNSFSKHSRTTVDALHSQLDEVLLASNLNVSGLGLLFLLLGWLLWNIDGQHAIVHRCLNLVHQNLRWQLDRSLKLAIAQFSHVIRLPSSLFSSRSTLFSPLIFNVCFSFI